MFVCLDSENGKVFWTIPHETYNNISAVTPQCHGDYAYFTSQLTGGTKIKLSQEGSAYTEIWSNQALDCLHGGVVLHEGNLYGSDSKGYWICQDYETGKIKFKEKLFEAKGSITYADGMLYCYCEKGILGLVKPTETGMDLISSFNISLGTHEHWTLPVIYDGCLYVRHGDVLMAFDIKKR
ncbi:MAG: hypothetical protein JXD22_09140 [Sedimentisphaerales bacterium]|nr:hypothetical protein [Sedimentisphaerales bacterium]